MTRGREIYAYVIYKCPIDPEKTVADLAHDFFSSIFMTPGTGLCFKDSGWYGLKDQSDNKKVNNIILSRFLPTLSISDKRQRDLCFNILKVCPELVHGFWGSTKISFEPKTAINHLEIMDFANQVVCLSVRPFFGNEQCASNGPPSVDVALSNIVPDALTKSTISRCLQQKSRDARFATIKLLTNSFEKFHVIFHQVCQIRKSSGSLDW